MAGNFQRELASLLNKHSIEKESDTPDHILAGYIRSCLDAFSKATKRRDNWNEPL